MVSMFKHVKPAVILGQVIFEKDIVNELIEEVERLRNTGKNAGTKLVGQLHNNEKSKQIDIDLTTDVGEKWKTVMNGVGDKYLTDMAGRLSRSDCFEVWANHAYAGDYNPYHTHGCNTPAGLSGFMWLSNPQSIEDKWDEWTAKLEPGAPKIPNLNNASGIIDGWTQCIWDVTSQRDLVSLKSVGEEWFKPTVGHMYIFPNWLHHQVYPFSGEGERLSIAMNWNVYDSDEQILMGRSEEQKKEFYAVQEKRKKEKEILDKSKEDGFWDESLL